MTTHDVDLSEIQSSDPAEIVADKARRAYEILQTPVVVEDVSAGLEKLGWLPGPFIKFFMSAMGDDALFKLAENEGERAKVACTIGYFDGETLLTVTGENYGTIVSPRGAHGFGFDVVFVPDGHAKTYAEMTSEEKDLVSHRSKALKLFAKKYAESFSIKN